jgi:hypothetical protein
MEGGKEMKLKKWVRVAITIVLFITSILIYSKTNVLGTLAQDSNFYLILAIMSWSWLMCGQFVIYELIWE